VSISASRPIMKFVTVPTDDGRMITLNGNNLQGALALSVAAVKALDQQYFDGDRGIILDALLSRSGDHQPVFIDHLKSLGFKKQRPFLRMAKGKQPPFGNPGRIFALAGPELG